MLWHRACAVRTPTHRRAMATSAHLDLALAAFRGVKRRNRVEPLDLVACVKKSAAGEVCENHVGWRGWWTENEGEDVSTMEFECVGIQT